MVTHHYWDDVLVEGVEELLGDVVLAHGVLEAQVELELGINVLSAAVVAGATADGLTARTVDRDLEGKGRKRVF